MDTRVNMPDEESFGIEVIIQEGDKKAPSCPHGPTLLFEKVCPGEPAGRRFYACSACRDRKDCNFFQWEDDKVSEDRRLAREAENRRKLPEFTHQEYCARFLEFVSLPLEQKRFCQDCHLLLLPPEWTAHSSHRALSDDITVARLRRPSLLLRPLENKKSNAQFLFADRSCHFLLDLLAGLGFRKVLCVGTPRLHELIKIRNLEGKEAPVRSLLLDIDFRYAQFYSEDEFCHYNMFNHHFFNGKTARGVLNAFLREVGGAKVVMVTDPPFGGLVKPLAHSFSQIFDAWKALNPSGNAEGEMPMFWIFPYFFESRILECFPTFSMLDYQVDYDNHPLYKHGKTGRKQSPVRLFTNLPPRDVVLPEQEGYRFCAVCERYVSPGNKHCPACDACTSKDGREWRHCELCSKCVKPTWLHCPACQRCTLPAHPCGGSEVQPGCFACGSPGHKRRACPCGSRARGARGRSEPPAKKRGGTGPRSASRKKASAHGPNKAKVT
ncbi:rRNA N6-adenosine-methyltransferase ZCCHC4 isoform X1 [Paramormyrops kingsleyae]|uniref:rRNA N(6)-adenosine-methyltransferase ZCCHC4 n=2 Tax=Paramormyrops kingsleyae TaxID=1676925 RepID=A0A3B3T8V6_9TELE|nr:zinc finger CCHC domain-containing protein 4 isoform X1 [Paramormyrops kingsleyae]